MNDKIEKQLRAALRAPEPNADFVALLGKQLSVFPPARAPRRTFRFAWGVVFGILVLLLGIFVIVGPERVVSAVARLFGYMPGAGFVENPATARLLPQAMTQERDGVRLTISQVAADENHTVVLYEISGIPEAWQVSPQESSGYVEEWEPTLQLADGDLNVRLNGTYTSLTLQDGKMSISGSFEFPALPAGVMQATLVWPRLPGLRAGAGPEDWQVEFTLQAGDVSGLLVEAQSPQVQSATQHELTLSLERVAYTADSTSLEVALDWEIPLTASWRELTLVDDLGRILPLVNEVQDTSSYQEGHNHQVNRYTTARLDPQRTYTLTLESLTANYAGEARFTFDLGANPQIGQEWVLDAPLQFRGYSLKVTGARAIRDEEQGTSGYEFDIQSEGELQGLYIRVDDPPGGGMAYSWPDTSKEFHCQVYFDGELPNRPLDVILTELGVRMEGPWQISWQPQIPADLPPQPTPTSPSRPVEEPTPMPPTGNAEADRVLALQDHFNAQFAGYTGWAQITEISSSPDQDSILPDGTPFPKTSVWENWYYVENGWVTRGVTLGKTEEGQVWQSAAWKDGWSYNFTLKEGNPYEPSRFIQNYALPRRVSDVLNAGGQISVEETTRDERAVLELQIDWPDDAYTRGYTEWYWLDLESGQVLGTASVSSGHAQTSIRILPVTLLPQAPAEIMQILDAFVAP